MTAFSPFAELRGTPQVTLGFHELGKLKGLYYDDLKTIVLRKGLLQAERRCTLAHELAHHRLGHTACHDRRGTRLQEVEAEVVAARWLIPLEAYVRARLWSHHDGEQAEELWVDVPMLHARREGFTEAERAYVEARLRGREWEAA